MIQTVIITVVLQKFSKIWRVHVLPVCFLYIQRSCEYISWLFFSYPATNSCIWRSLWFLLGLGVPLLGDCNIVLRVGTIFTRSLEHIAAYTHTTCHLWYPILWCPLLGVVIHNHQESWWLLLPKGHLGVVAWLGLGSPLISLKVGNVRLLGCFQKVGRSHPTPQGGFLNVWSGHLLFHSVFSDGTWSWSCIRQGIGTTLLVISLRVFGW